MYTARGLAGTCGAVRSVIFVHAINLALHGEGPVLGVDHGVR